MGVLAVLLLKALFWVFAIALPIVGAWILSSLIAYANGPVWLAFVALFTLIALAMSLYLLVTALERVVTRP